MLKTLSFLILVMVSVGCTAQKNLVQQNSKIQLWEDVQDSMDKKLLRGLLTINQISTDTSFKWYSENLRFFKADSSAVQQLRAKKENLQFVIFCGTWCTDSQQLLPKYLSTLSAAQIGDSQITLFGVDRNKTTIANLQKTFNVISIPTLIMMQDGKEVGRIVEYGQTALVHKELETLLNNIPQ